jgi:hypothetical protein
MLSDGGKGDGLVRRGVDEGHLADLGRVLLAGDILPDVGESRQCEAPEDLLPRRGGGTAGDGSPRDDGGRTRGGAGAARTGARRTRRRGVRDPSTPASATNRFDPRPKTYIPTAFSWQRRTTARNSSSCRGSIK